jgi:hypothetical protein
VRIGDLARRSHLRKRSANGAVVRMHRDSVEGVLDARHRVELV